MTPDQIEQMRKAFRKGARGLELRRLPIAPQFDTEALVKFGDSMRKFIEKFNTGFDTGAFRRAADTAYIKNVARNERRIARASLAATVKRVRDEMGLASDG